MFDPITLDQLRAFVTVVEEGSFSAAARKLQRVQSAISTQMANLESQLALPLWDRSTKVARLTPQGEALLAAARRVLGEVDSLRRVASGMVKGLEPTVSLCLDALFPLEALLDLCTAFTKEFPSVDLRIDTQVLTAVSAKVLDGSATLGVATPAGIAPGLERHVLAPVRMLPVASAKHPLAKVRGKITKAHVAEVIQIVLSERSDGDEGSPDQGVMSPRTWRVADLQTKHALVSAGLGWGNLPEHIVRAELRRKRLVALHPDGWAEDETSVPLCAIHRQGAVFGPAHRWLLQKLSATCAGAVDPHRTNR